MRLYLNQALATGETVNLPSTAHHHVVTVCRQNSGDTIILFNGSGQEYIGTLKILSRKQSSVDIIGEQNGLAPSPLHCHLGIGISASSRFDLIIQKATELGISEITPLITEKSVRYKHSEKKQQHWEQIIVSASEQSGRCELPVCHAPQMLNEWVNRRNEEQKLIASLQEEPVDLSGLPTPGSVALLIGPASGFTLQEESTALANNFHSFTLGPRTLRTETACFSAISLFQFLWGN